MIFQGNIIFPNSKFIIVLQSEIEKCCQEDNCLWIIEDSDLMDLPFDKTWPLSPFKYKVSYLEMVQYQTYINFEIFLG